MLQSSESNFTRSRFFLGEAMPLAQRTNIYITTAAIADDDTLKGYQNKYMAVADMKCIGKGRTITRFFTPPTRIPHIYLPSSLTQAEWANAKEAAELPGEALDFEALLKDIFEAQPWYDLFYHRDFFGDDSSYPVDEEMLEAHPCYDTFVWYRVEYINIEVSIKASQDITLGGTNFAKDAVIAAFTVIRPQDLLIELSRKFNEECCAKEPEDPPKQDESERVDITSTARFMRENFRTDVGATFKKHR